MRAELPWNVAGIPPEAREAARAAARREGLSVGEWLTRRILRSFSDLGDEPMPFDRAYGGGLGGGASSYGGTDSWGLPQSAAARRDSEEMLARVSRSETESNDSWRRIEEQLRGVSRRLDSSERSQSENNRVLSKTAAEMNIAAREQAQVFDQMGQSMMAISERLERLERDQATSGVRDAVKALHQGLSRLADQIGQTANQSAAQVTVVTQNLDQLAHRLGQARDDGEYADKQLSDRIAQLDDRFGAADGRLAHVEKTAQFTTNAIDHALEKLEAQTQQRANDQVDWQRRAGGTEESLQRLEDSVIRLERAGNDPALERRLDGIETSLHGLVARLENDNPAAPLEETVHLLSRRLEAMEKSHGDLLNEMRANIVTGAPAPAFQAASFQPAPSQAPFEAPPFAEPPPAAGDSAPFLPPYGTETFSPDAFAAGQFTETPDAESDDPFAPLGGMLAPEAGEENFLAAARRSAREAAEKNQAAKSRRFPWSKSADAGAGKSRLLLPLTVMLGVALVAGAAAVLSQRLHHAPPVAATPASTSSVQPFTPAPVIGTPPGGSDASQPDSPDGDQNAGDQNAGDQNAAAPAQAQQPRARQPQARAATPPSLDRIAQLANAGNATAQTIIGIRALGGADGSAANPAEAFKWLSKAAAQGQGVAQYRLGTLYERGQGVAASPANAAHWYELAAAQGNRLAMYNLAVAQANKSLGKQNMPEAARWFSKAAALGVGDAQFNLAVLYERGDGVPQSLLDAYKWYSIAGAGGDNGAQQRAAVLATQLAEADRAAALKSAQAFKAQPLIRAANVPPTPADLAGAGAP